MKKQLLYLLPLFALCLGAVSIKWFNDYPAGRPLATNDIVAIQRTGPNRYVYGDLNDVKNLIGGGGGGAQVWTNDGFSIKPTNETTMVTMGDQTNSISTNTVTRFFKGFLASSQVSFPPLPFTQNIFDLSVVYADSNFVTTPNPPPIFCSASYLKAFDALNNFPSNSFGVAFYAENEVVQSDISVWPLPGGSALYGYSDDRTGKGFSAGSVSLNAGEGNMQGGSVSGAEETAANQTNIASVNFVVPGGNPGSINIVGLFESPAYEGDDIAKCENAILILDNRATSYPLILGRTNNGTTVAKLSSLGIWTSQGTISPSNATPAIPTAAALGAGGYWDGNSNGFKVTIWSDGATTTMKVWGPPF